MGVLVSELCSPEGVLRCVTVNVLLRYVRFPTGVEEKAGETGTPRSRQKADPKV